MIHKKGGVKMDKKIDIIWSVSLIVISLVSLTLSISNIIGTALPSAVSTALGIIDLCALPLLVYSSIKKIKK